MLPRGWLVRICMVAACIAAVSAIGAVTGLHPACIQAMTMAVLVCVGAAVAIPCAPQQWRQPTTQFGRMVTAFVALCVINGIVAAAAADSSTFEGFLLLAFSVAWNGMLALVVALPSLLMRRRSDARRTRAQGIAIWSAAGTVLILELVGLALALGPFGRAWMPDTFMGLQGLTLVLLGAGSLAAMVDIRPGASSAPETRRRAIPTLFEVVRAACFASLILATGMYMIPYAIFWADRMRGGYTSQFLDEWLFFVMLLAVAPIGMAVWNTVGTLATGRASGFLRVLATLCCMLGIAMLAVPFNPEITPWSHGAIAVLGAILFLVGLCAAVAAAGIGWLATDSAARLAPIDSFSWRCPRCSGWFAVKSGVDQCCTRCGLSVCVSVREDRCPKCNYDLHGFGERAVSCPECGRVRQVTAAGHSPDLPASTPGGEHVAQVGAVHPPVAGEIGG